jgi:hypothetical protein
MLKACPRVIPSVIMARMQVVVELPLLVRGVTSGVSPELLPWYWGWGSDAKFSGRLILGYQRILAIFLRCCAGSKVQNHWSVHVTANESHQFAHVTSRLHFLDRLFPGNMLSGNMAKLADVVKLLAEHPLLCSLSLMQLVEYLTRVCA